MDITNLISVLRLTIWEYMNRNFWPSILLLLLTAGSVHPQQSNAESKKSYFFPSANHERTLTFFAGLSMAQLPTKIVEDVFDQVPMLEFKVNWKFHNNFSANAEINTNVLTNLLSISPEYSISLDKLSIGLGSEALFWYGFYKSDGFNVSVLGWGYSPFAVIGYDFNDFMISLKAELSIKSQNAYMRSLKYKDDSPKFTGFTFTLAVEQPFWGDNYFALGFRANYTNFFYKSWLSFSAFDEYTFYPEFFAGFVF